MNERSYGWVVVLCAFTLMFVGFGAAYSFAAFFRAFQSEFGASRAPVSIAFSLCAFIYFLLGAPAGMLADRHGTRMVALAGVAFLVAGLVGASYANSVEMLYLTYSIGLGIGIGLTYVPSVGAVLPWFNMHRVLASGIAVSGIGVGMATGLYEAAFAALGLLFDAGGTAVNVAVALGVAGLRRRASRHAPARRLGLWLERTAGLLFVALGLRLALGARA